MKKFTEKTLEPWICHVSKQEYVAGAVAALGMAGLIYITPQTEKWQT